MKRIVSALIAMLSVFAASQAQYRIMINTDEGRKTVLTSDVSSISFANGTLVINPVSGVPSAPLSYTSLSFAHQSWSLGIDNVPATTTDIYGNSHTWTSPKAGQNTTTTTDFEPLGLAQTAGLEFKGGVTVNSTYSCIQGTMAIRVPVIAGQEVTISFSNTGSSNGERFLAIDGTQVKGSASTSPTSYTYTVSGAAEYIVLQGMSGDKAAGLRFYSINVKDPAAPPTQTIKPTLTFDSATGKATISTLTPDANITYSYYPNTTGEGNTYSEPFSVSEATVIYAKAQADGLDASEIASLTISKVATPAISQTGNRVKISCATAGATILYSIDNGTTWVADNKYVATSAEVTKIWAKATLEGSITSEVATSAVTYDAALTSLVTILDEGGWFEAGYVTWEPFNNAEGYNVYYKKNGTADYVKLDGMLVRSYGSYIRADMVGISAGDYLMKVVPCNADGDEMIESAAETAVITVTAHDRAGYAFQSAATTPGAYKADGTLKDNAIVVYITDNNKNTVTASINIEGKGGVTCTGLQGIIDGYKKGKETRPLCIRMIGNINDPSYMLAGDIVIENKNSTTGITIQGIGNDAVANGWGIRIKNGAYVEICNIGTMNCDSDEGDNIGLQQDNDHIWVHNCDFFYGNAGSDADQIKGDGALDCKKSTYVTFSYNHFWDNGKCNLLGLSEGTNSGLYITYHHNWYDHSDSRHPRIRYYTAHVYNNYYDGNAKYGIGSTLGSSVFAEANYFRNCSKPMLTSKQGTDINNGVGSSDQTKGTFSNEDGGTIKAYNNIMVGKYRFQPYSDTNTQHFDAYVAQTRDEKVPSTVKALQGGATHNNFDTASDMYAYAVHDPADVPSVIMGDLGAGRMQHGDLQWTFNNDVDDTSYAVNAGLKAAVSGYKTKLVKVFGDSQPAQPSVPSGGETGGETGGESGGGEAGGSETGGSTGTTIEGAFTYVFKKGTTVDPKLTVAGNYKSGTVTANGTEYVNPLKMESSTSIKFTTKSVMTLTLITDLAQGGKIKVDNESKAANANGVVIIANLPAGAHEITKDTSCNLCQITLE